MKEFKILFVVVCFVFFNIPTYSQDIQLGDRYYETAGGYSLCPPKGWSAREYRDLKYHLLIGPSQKGMTPNIVFVEEQYLGSLKEYVDDSIIDIEENLDYYSYKLVSRSKFTTNDNMEGEKLIFLDEEDKHRCISYIFSKGNLKMTITCITPFDDSYDKIFDESIKTFRW